MPQSEQDSLLAIHGKRRLCVPRAWDGGMAGASDVVGGTGVAAPRGLDGANGAGPMKYAIDTEFIDTEEFSWLISLAVVRQDGQARYYEFDYPAKYLSPWLIENVVPHLSRMPAVPFTEAAADLRDWLSKANDPHPEFWAYYASYDWYWLCRVMGGLMQTPDHWPKRVKDFADYGTVPQYFVPKHHALADARSLMMQMHKHAGFFP